MRLPNSLRKRLLPVTGIAAGAFVAGLLTLRPGTAAASDSAAKSLDSDQKILHALNRLAFGPRPGDVEAVRRLGLNRWIDQQLNPDAIDDSAAQGKLANLTSLTLPSEQLMDMFKNDQQKNRLIAQAKKEAAQQAQNAAQTGQPAAQSPPANSAAPNNPTTANPPALPTVKMRPGLDSIVALGELDDEKILLACESKRQMQEVLVDFWTNHFNLDVKKGPVRTFKLADDRDVIRPHVFGKFRDLLEASAKSPAMLFYLDNASSTRDFNDPNSAMPLRRPFARPGFGNGRFGRRRFQAGNGNPPFDGFASPAQTMPLQTGASSGVNPSIQAAPPANKGKKRGGLNENYGRELMELHTLGVDGGYTQKDVQEVARCFTGWSIDRQTGAFRFYPARHDNGSKLVLGHRIPAGGGVRDGEMVLDILASHPSTAHFISRKLCTRFVSDNPPASLVDKAARTFLSTDGDLRAVVRTIVTSPEFFAPDAYRAKMKSPFEYAVSSVRALDGTIAVPDPSASFGRLRLLADGATSVSRGKGAKAGRRNAKRFRTSLPQEIAAMGEPLFSHEAPTGYPEDSREWLSSGALLARFNFAVALSGGKVAEVEAAPDSLLQGVSMDNADAVVTKLSQAMLGTDLSASTRSAILKQSSAPVDPVRIAGLLLGSPEFQRR